MHLEELPAYHPYLMEAGEIPGALDCNMIHGLSVAPCNRELGKYIFFFTIIFYQLLSVLHMGTSSFHFQKHLPINASGGLLDDLIYDASTKNPVVLKYVCVDRLITVSARTISLIVLQLV